MYLLNLITLLKLPRSLNILQLLDVKYDLILCKIENKYGIFHASLNLSTITDKT